MRKLLTSIRHRRSFPSGAEALGVAFFLLVVTPLTGLTQEKSGVELQQQVETIQAQLQSAQRQVDEQRAELLALRSQLEALSRQMQKGAGSSLAEGPSPEAASELQQAVADLQERQTIQQSEIQGHEQEKVGTASKYALTLHGLLLFNTSLSNGSTDAPALPTIAIPAAPSEADGSLTATGRQTLLGLAATGPLLWGAHTYADLEADFSGGLSSAGYGNGGNLFRLRTATMEMAWPKTTVQAGIAPLILTPYYPTSYFSIAEPALSWSGSLWSWLPQVSVEHRLALSEDQHFAIQAALADIPDAGTSDKGLGGVSAGERSRYPGSEMRLSWQRGARLPSTVGLGGYWSPHSYSGIGELNAWAATADWKVSLPGRVLFSGEVYKGSALGGLSAGAYKDGIMSYRQPNESESTKLTGLRDAGGWTQVKVEPSQRLELNFAFGLDNADSRQLREAILDLSNPFAGLARNQTLFGNIVFRPQSTLILSGEYRQIHSWQIAGPADFANLFGLAVGYAF